MDILNYIDKMQQMYGDKEPRPMFANGQLVQPNNDGSRPGYQGKNQFTGNNPLNIKQSTYNLIPEIKKDSVTMSEKEVKKKYKIHKSTFKKIKNAENIEFRKSYKPTGTQKKEIPYADRFTAKEKSDMYKKRKATETEEDRIKKRERDAKYRDKIYKDYKMEPSSRSSYDNLWKDITRSSKEGNRIKLVEGPKYSSGASYDDFKTRVFLDTKTGETFNYNNLKQYLDSGKLEGVTYKSVIEPYDIKNQIAKSGLREEIQKAYFGDKYQSPKMFRAQNTFHVHHIGGVAADPFTTQLTFADQNLGLVTNKKFNKEWAKLIERNAPLSERKNYLKFVKSKIGDNIAQTLEFPEVGKTRTFGEIGTDMQKLLSSKKLSNLKPVQIKSIAKKLEAAGFKCQLANGLTCNDPRAYTQSIKENMAKVKQGDNTAISKVAKLGKTMNAFKGAAKATGWGLLAELGFAAPLAAVDYAKGANRDEIISNATYGLFGKSEDEQLKERYADYGKAQKLKDTYNNLLEAENLAKTGAGYRTQAVNKLRAEDLNKKLFEQSKPFNTILPPSMGFKGELDYDRFLNAELRDKQRRDEFAKEKEQRSKEIGILQPSTGLEAIQLAGGGIAGLSGGDKSGRPPESGPASQGLRSLIKNGNKL